MLLNGGNSASPSLGNGTNRGNTAGRYCGTSPPTNLQTASNFLFVNFISDETGAGAGFQLTYSEVAVTCGGSLTLTDAVRSGYFSSPNHPANYPHNVDCQWVITAPANQRVAIHFEDQFNIETNRQCNFDYIEFRDGGSITADLIGNRTCGAQLGNTQYSTGNVMFVRFRTDNSVTRVGFKARYEIATCGGRINGASGTITSPNYPQNYDSNLDCEWIIITTVGHYITFTFNAVNIQSSTNCAADSLVIRDRNSTGVVLITQCGSTTPNSVQTSDSFAYLRFKSDGSGVSTGFSVSFQASVESCGGDLASPTGVLTSPNYPGLYAHNRQCEWRITVQQGRRITLTFTDFRLERQTRTCNWDYIDVFNGLLRLSPRLGRYCGETDPGVIESSGPYMRVVFRTDGSVSNGGFRATYTSNNEAVCGGVLTGESNITSPGYIDSGNYTNKLDCIWQVNNPSEFNSSIKIIVRDLALESHRRCSYDFIDIREGDSIDAPRLAQFCGNNTIPPPLVSPSTSLWIRFRTDSSIVDRGFWLDVEINSCGGMLTDTTGVITSPNYPETYNHGDFCAWQILAPEGQRIRITYDDMDLENSPTCQYDYLQVFNGGNADSPLAAKYCSQLTQDFVSQSNSVRFVFRTDGSVGAGGFKIRYQFETDACGGLFHSDTGSLQSPNFPARYPHNVECVWDINVDVGYTVLLTFNDTFDLEAANCRYDYVQIFDVLTNGTEINRGKWCGSTSPDPTPSVTNHVRVKFRSDVSSNGNGFAADWSTACGATITSNLGLILSPGYPRSYSNNLECNYTIAATPNEIVSIAFDSVFELEGPASCRYDYVQLFSGGDNQGSSLGRFCGTTAPQIINSIGPVFLQFITDRSLTFKGFKFRYIVQECGGVFNTSSGTISSISHPNPYLNSHDCQWVIRVAPNRTVEFKFNRFSLETSANCRFDYVEVRDGLNQSAPLIGRYCGSVVPDIIYSTGNILFINFVTDSSVSDAGFHAAFRETYGPRQGCGGILNNTAGGTFTSLDADGDGKYENNLNCYWTIAVDSNKVATINFTRLNLEGGSSCVYDYILVHNGASRTDPVIGRYCGSQIPALIVGLSNSLFVEFVTDGSINFAGFSAIYGSQNRICGGILTATTSIQTITTPNYPSPAGQALHCRWIVDSSATNKQVRFKFTAISLAQDSTCSQEYVEFRDRPMEPNGRNIHYCGTTIPASFDTYGRVGVIDYVLPDGSNSPGFSLNYQIASCNKNFTGSSGRIVSPGWPGDYPSNSDCDIRITAPVGSSITLYFTVLRIEQHSSCNFDYLAIYNGTSKTDPQLTSVCGYQIPSPVFTNNNVVYLNFKTDSSVAHAGYDISYTASTNGPGCGGNMTGISGTLTSPDYPGNFSDVATCGWLITIPVRRTLTLTFTSLSVQGVARCAENYVAVYDGNSDSANVLGRYCNTIPAQLTASSNKAYVKYVSTGSATAPAFSLSYTS